MKGFLVDSQQDLDQTFIKDLRLSKRTFNALRRRGVFTVGKLNELFHNNKLENIHFIGQKSIDEVSTALNEFYKEASNPVNNEKTSKSALPLLEKIAQNDIDFMSIEILNLHASTRGALIKNGIKTIGELRTHDR